MSRYREGKEKLLITTNLCARGIDVEQVTVVVNYDVPVDVHRQYVGGLAVVTVYMCIV